MSSINTCNTSRFRHGVKIFYRQVFRKSLCVSIQLLSTLCNKNDVFSKYCKYSTISKLSYRIDCNDSWTVMIYYIFSQLSRSLRFSIIFTHTHILTSKNVALYATSRETLKNYNNANSHLKDKKIPILYTCVYY